MKTAEPKVKQRNNNIKTETAEIKTYAGDKEVYKEFSHKKMMEALKSLK